MFSRRPRSLRQAMLRSLIVPTVVVAMLGAIFGVGTYVATALGHPQAHFTTVEK